MVTTLLNVSIARPRYTVESVCVCQPHTLSAFATIAVYAAVISAETMELHHSKHHATYVNNLNVALEKLDAAVSAADVSTIIALQPALKFNGGGHLNHSLFWENLAPMGGELQDGPLKALVMECYGDFDTMKTDLNAVTIAVQGSGWGWLGFNPKSGTLLQGECTHVFITCLLKHVFTCPAKEASRPGLARTRILCRPRRVLFL